MRLRLAVLFLAAAVVVALPAAATVGQWEAEHIELDRQVRAMRDYFTLPPLPEAFDLSVVATEHSWAMARVQGIWHSDLTRIDGPYESLGENVASAPLIWLSVRSMMDSPTHRSLLLGDWADVGYGHIRAADGQVYVTIIFRR